MTPDTIVNDFRDAMLGAGLTPPDHIEADGKVHRFSTNGKRSDAAGWYCLHLDGLPAGIFGDWRQGLTVTWCSKSDEAMTPAERAAMRETIRALLVQRQADQQRRQEQAKASAMQAWEAAGDCTGHPYLQRKGVHGYGLRQYGGLLMIPLRDTSGTLHSIQTITPDGDKRFQAGGRVRGCYHAIGKPAGVIVVCEGYATGASIHEVTGHAVAVAFNAGNLQAVAQALHRRCTGATLTCRSSWPLTTITPRRATPAWSRHSRPRYPWAAPWRYRCSTLADRLALPTSTTCTSCRGWRQ